MMQHFTFTFHFLGGVTYLTLIGLLIYGYVNFWRKGAPGAAAAA